MPASLRLWWRGLDSNQRSLRRQIYSLMDLTTLPPLLSKVAGSEATPRRGALSGRFMVIGRVPVNTQSGKFRGVSQVLAQVLAIPAC